MADAQTANVEATVGAPVVETGGDQSATNPPSGSILVQNGGPDAAHWIMPWITYVLCGGVGCVGAGGLMPRCAEQDMKLLCIQNESSCDFGSKESLCACGKGGQCCLIDMKALIANFTAEGSCESCLTQDAEKACIKSKGISFCRTEAKEVGGSCEQKNCCLRCKCTQQLEHPIKEGVFCRCANRICCTYTSQLAKITEVGGPKGFLTCNSRTCCIVQNGQCPPKVMFCEICTVRLMGPKKTRDLKQPAAAPGGAVVVQAVNFGNNSVAPEVVVEDEEEKLPEGPLVMSGGARGGTTSARQRRYAPEAFDPEGCDGEEEPKLARHAHVPEVLNMETSKVA